MYKRAVAIALALTILTASCGGSDDQTGPITTAEQMCDRLAELAESGLSAPEAYNVILEEDLVDVTGQALADFAALLLRAPQESCPQYTDYADEVHYWVMGS